MPADISYFKILVQITFTNVSTFQRSMLSCFRLLMYISTRDPGARSDVLHAATYLLLCQHIQMGDFILHTIQTYHQHHQGEIRRRYTQRHSGMGFLGIGF